ncbi:MAG: hypothetical protein QF915_00225, partial [Candidatus Woesearchaeota archaeon]|nr:hypothetical protein [Candidatus Woesearchaeota archaeon]
SPLVSSVLLISFAIVLGILVMSWGKAEQGKRVVDVCDKAGVEIVSINDELQACYTDTKIFFTAGNTGEGILSGIKVTAIGSQDIGNEEVVVDMGPADVTRLETIYGGNVGELLQVRFAPEINLGEVCANKIFIVDEISRC